MKDVFGQELAVGDDVAIRRGLALYRGRIIRFTAKQATVEHTWSPTPGAAPVRKSLSSWDIIKMVEGDHKPDLTALPINLSPTPAIPAFVFDPDPDASE